MRRLVSILLSLFVVTGLWSISAYAQTSPVGTYTGAYALPSGTSFQVRVVIDSYDNGLVKGKAELFDGPCRGNYPMQGSYNDTRLQFSSTSKGGITGDCVFTFSATSPGTGKFVGALGNGWPIELSK